MDPNSLAQLYGGGAPQQQQPQIGGGMGMDPEQLKQLLFAGLMGGQFDSGQVGMLARLGGINLDEAKPQISPEKQSMISQGLSSLGTIGELSNTGNYLAQSLPDFMRPGDARILDTATRNLSDIIGRLRSGAQVTADEEARFRQLLPGTWDDDKTKEYKIGEIQRGLTDIMNRPDPAQFAQQYTAGGQGGTNDLAALYGQQSGY